MHGLGLSIFPVGVGDEGKRPFESWKAFQTEAPSISQIQEWLVKHPKANIALATGALNNVTVIDCDDPNRTIGSLQKEFGETKLIVQTPKGGHHLYYSHNGERSVANPKTRIDVRGAGGYVLIPPSANPKLNRPYRIVKGDFSDIGNLGSAKHPSLVGMPSLHTKKPESSTKQVKGRDTYTIPEGGRNNALFKHLMSKRHDCKNRDALLAAAALFNQKHCRPMLCPEEVNQVVESVLRYEKKGTRGEKYVPSIPFARLEELASTPRAWTLYCYLFTYHRNKTNGEQFAVSQKEVGIKLQWNEATVGSAIKVLIELGILKKLRTGGKGQHDKSLYAFS